MKRLRWYLVLLTVLLAACSVRTTGADTISDLRKEDHYKGVYSEHISRFHEDLQLLAPSPGNPGVCNAGGTKQGCYDADLVLIQDLQSFLAALESIDVPPRYVEAHFLLMEGLEKNIRALELRNQAIAESDDEPFQEHKLVLQEAVDTG